jgi:hypothetical protein
MKYSRFEELPVWKAAIELAVKTYDLTARPQFKGLYSLRDQIERAGFYLQQHRGRVRARKHTGGSHLYLHSAGLSGRGAIDVVAP